MPQATLSEEPLRWGDRLRRIPAGILLIAALLVILGVGSITGGAYLLLQDGTVSLWAVATGLIAGPAILYLAYHLVRLTYWTWTTLIVLLVLMAASSLVRLLVVPGLSIAPIGELVVEVLAAAYLTRPGVKGAFRRRDLVV